MEFAEAAFLAGLAAVALPIVLHLLHRGRSRKIPFPSVRFLRDVEVRSARRKRIEEWATLLLRATAIAALALALARPVLRGSAARLGERSRAVVIDDSMSMDARGPGGSALERSIAFARELLRRSGAADRVAIVPVWGEASPLSEDKSRAEAALAAIRPTWRDSPLLAAVRRALALLAEDRNPAKELYVLSDLQASAFEGAEPLAGAPPAGVTTVLLRPAVRSAANAALISAEPEPGGLLRVRLRAHGGEVVARLQLSLGGRPHAERSVRAESEKEASTVFPLPDLPPGLHRARVRSGDDVLPADDVLEAAIEVLPERTAIVARDAERASSSRDPASYLAAALASGANRRRAPRVELRAIEDLSAADLSRAGAVFLLEPSAIPDALGAALADFVRRGGGLFVALGAGLGGERDAPSGRAAPPWLPVAPSAIALAEGAPFRIASWDGDHPIWRPLLGASPPLRPDAPAFLAYRRLSLSEGARAIASFSSGDPALVVREEGAGKVVVFASTLGGDWSNLPLRLVFAPWVHSVLDHLGPGPRKAERLLPGARVVVRRPRGSGFRSVRVEPPDGAARTVLAAPGAASAPGPSTPPGSEESLSADLGELEAPGIYLIAEEYEGGAATRVLSVVPSERESDLEPLGRAELERIFPGAHLVEFASPLEALARAAAVAEGSELKPPLLALLLALLLIEPLVANRSAFRRGAAPSPPASPRTPAGASPRPPADPRAEEASP